MENKTSDEMGLFQYEWIVVLSLISFMAILMKLGWNAPEDRWPEKEGVLVAKPVEFVVVCLEGAVEKAGRHHFPQGTTLRNALEKVVLLPEADLSKLDLDQVLKRRQKIKVPFTNKKLSKKS